MIMTSNSGEGFRNISPIPKVTTMIERSNLANSMPPETQTGIYNNLIVGVGNYVFKVTEEGMWLGAEQFENAPFRVDMNGNVELTGYIEVSGAAADVNAGTVTINGGKITAQSINSDQIASNAIVTRLIAAGQILATHIKAHQITANEIAANTITANEVVAGTFVSTGGAAGDVNAGTTTINGGKITAYSISADKIVAGTFVSTGGAAGDVNAGTTTINGGKITAYSISADKLSVTSLSAITATLGSVNSGTITSSTIIIPNENNGVTGYLKWSGGSRIWNDDNNWMGYRSLGGRHYFYSGNYEKLVLMPNGYQNYIINGLESRGNFNVGRGYSARFGQDGYTSGMTVYINGYSYLYNTLTVYAGIVVTGTFAFSGSTSVMNCHVNSSQGVYNFGSSTYYWGYMNAKGFTTHSMTSFNSPVKLPDGKEVDDITALKSIKERKEIKDERTGRIVLDKRSFPVDIMVKAYDSDTGKEYKRDKNNDPLIPNKQGKLEARPDADGVDLVQFTSLLFGGFKQLVDRVEKLEKGSSKNVKI